MGHVSRIGQQVGAVTATAWVLLIRGSCLAAPETSMELARRDYHIETQLVEAGKTRAVIVSSSRQPSYADIARQVQQRVRELTGVELPMVDAEQTSTDEVLTKTNAVVLGNLVTSKFVETLYWEWYTITDLWYPGKGGYEVRTVHDPYGTGKNVILLGGSDDQGVKEATESFCALLSKGDPLKVGRLMQIRLGEGCPPPKPTSFTDWVDPRWRIFRDVQGAPLGHTLASKAGIIYYYCGDEAYAKRFRDMALNTDMLSNANHYYAHMNAIAWDLVEESPVFSDEDREKITRKLLTHVRGPDAAGSIEKLADYREDLWLLDRHSSMMAICTLTESRYFSKYWPSEEWTRNLSVVRNYFNRQMTTAKGDSDLGGRGIYTYFECALIPALLLRDRRFLDSGALRQWGELCLMHCDNTGYMPQSGQSNSLSYPTFALPACAALLHDGSFLATMKRREEAERIASTSVTPSSFMTGQPWSTGLLPQPMKKMIGVYHLPLTRWEYEVRGKAIPFEESFDRLTMRTGFERDDQYLLLDGLYGGPAGKPWPDVNAIVAFGQNGRIFLDNSGAGESPVQHDVVTVSKDGFGAETDRVAALKAVANLPSFGYSHSRVKGYSFSSWDRHIFWWKGAWFVVLDRLAATEQGRYSFECQWQTIGEPAMDGSNYTSTVWEWSKENAPRDVFHIKNAERLPLRYTQQLMGVEGGEIETIPWQHYCQRKGINRIRQVASKPMKVGDEQVFTNLLYVGGDRTKARYNLVKLNSDVAVLTGDESAYLGLTRDGRFERGPLHLEAVAFCASPQSIAVVKGTRIELPGMRVEATAPCNLELHLTSGQLTCETRQPVLVKAGGRQHQCSVGTTTLKTAPPTLTQIGGLKQQIERDAAAATAATSQSPEPEQLPSLAPVWTYEANAEVLVICATDAGAGKQEEVLLGLADGRVSGLDGQAKERWAFRAGGPVRAVAVSRFASAPVVLVGSDDQHVYALPAGGGAPLWKHRCEVAPDNAGWTTRGEARVQAILPQDLDGDGKVEVICGTGGGAVETLSETGERKWFTPIRYGVPDRLAVVPMPDGSKTLLVSCSATSFQSMTRRLAADGRLLEENAMYRQRGADMSPAPGLKVSDLDGDGRPEAIIGRGGGYPELALHDAAVNGKPKWMYTLADNVTCVDAVDTNNDGKAEVVAGSPSGWLTVFSFAGKQLWAAQMPHEICALSAAGGKLFVACADANVYQVNLDGRITGRYHLGGSPTCAFTRAGESLLLGSSKGRVVALRVSP